MADWRQIMWRKFLISLCKNNIMTPVVLPHNLASPFFLFLSSWCCPLSIAILCGRKSPMDLKVAPMLKKMVLTYNVAPQSFFLRLTQKPVAKKSLGCLAILCVRNGALSARKIVPHYLADPGILYVKPQHQRGVTFRPARLPLHGCL